MWTICWAFTTPNACIKNSGQLLTEGVFHIRVQSEWQKNRCETEVQPVKHGTNGKGPEYSLERSPFYTWAKYVWKKSLRSQFNSFSERIRPISFSRTKNYVINCLQTLNHRCIGLFQHTTTSTKDLGISILHGSVTVITESFAMPVRRQDNSDRYEIK